MKITRNILRSMALAATALFAAVAPLSAEDVTIAYPTAESPHFMITAPDAWKLEPAEEEGGYFGLTGPTDAVFYFRSIAAADKSEAKASLDAAIKESFEYLGENYAEIKMEDPKDDKVNGLEGFYVSGTGKQKDGDAPAVFVMAWYFLGNGQIGEVWFVTTPDDKEGFAQAQSIMKTFQAPK